MPWTGANDGCGGFAVPVSAPLILPVFLPDPTDPLVNEATPNEGSIYLGHCEDGAR